MLSLESNVSLPDATRSFLSTVDFGSLEIEQRARVRNLAFNFQRSIPPLRALLNPLDLHKSVMDFCDDLRFWQPRGRALFENFCLYAAEVTSNGVLADALSILGAQCGLAVAPEVSTPWRGHQRMLKSPIAGARAIEKFFVSAEALVLIGTEAVVNGARIQVLLALIDNMCHVITLDAG
jgi:hypothetical protein